MDTVRSRRPSIPGSLVLCLALSTTLLLSACSGSGSGTKTLQSIGVTPSNPSLGAGTTLQLTATGTYSDQSTQDLTPSAAWTSSDAGVVTVSSTGLITAVAPGSATVTATSGSVAGSTTVTGPR